jgi:hypothetical protein
MMYERKTTNHHQSQNDTIHPVRQYARIATWPLHILFIRLVNRLSADMESNANGTISTKRIHVNAATLSSEQ